MKSQPIIRFPVLPSIEITRERAAYLLRASRSRSRGDTERLDRHAFRLAYTDATLTTLQP